jgi:hypothetical protein
MLRWGARGKSKVLLALLVLERVAEELGALELSSDVGKTPRVED